MNELKSYNDLFGALVEQGRLKRMQDVQWVVAPNEIEIVGNGEMEDDEAEVIEQGRNTVRGFILLVAPFVLFFVVQSVGVI